ncbi:C45 family autoproteolytic acyltransferase/hydolase [Paenibacillus aceti]|uniref:Peptidase C45 hydrolase domain-containing protein n=1 Tax=Paenibacillus aceti TaxID=1820010 RepID=A0ABQ1W4F6_9BACL|nr:C45 family peptidase [Paenibacillus aceti]GGG13873.1 hypothetical protein GCM10010913_39610 [Paenibacillus aceti]
MSLYVNEQQLSLGTDSFMTVRHLTLKGSNYEIGQHLAAMAQTRYNIHIPSKPQQALPNRCQRKYILDHYPLYYERMRGMAKALNIHLEDDDYNLNELMYRVDPFGCSAVYYPPSKTETGHGMLSRNFDYWLLALDGQEASPDNPAMLSEPYIIELYPDEGYASLCTTNYDLAGAVLDGINEKGLVVAVFSDDESKINYPPEPCTTHRVGLHELQIMRYLLDTCATVEEAKAALLSHKIYYGFHPLHYMIADRSGNSFVFEYSYTTNRCYIIDAETEPLPITNFLLHRYSADDTLPDSDMYNRYNVLKEKLTAHSPKLFSYESIRDINSLVYVKPCNDYPVRTLWHSIYNTHDVSMSINFYIKDVPGGCKRSSEFQFQLEVR